METQKQLLTLLFLYTHPPRQPFSKSRATARMYGTPEEYFWYLTIEISKLTLKTIKFMGR